MRRLMHSLIITAFAVTVFAAAHPGVPDLEMPPVDTGLVKNMPAEYREGVEKSLRLAGKNAPEIEKFLEGVKEKRLGAAAFLVANMAPSALASLKADDLASEFKLAFKAWKEFPWGKQVPEDVFLHYVLPNFMSQEPFEKYREYLYPLLVDALSNCSNMKEAALELNRWCKERYRYKYTQPRDQGVFESLKRGYGRCEEMMIIYMAAARTACLPVRQESTPAWPVTRDNHAWVGVWCDGKWYYLGACEPADELNKAWFTEVSKRSALVLATVYGKTKKIGENELIYRDKERYTIINVTGNYSKTGKAIVKVKGLLKKDDKDKKEKEDDDSKKDDEQNVYLHLYNFGCLRPFARVILDETGSGEITLGIGEFIATYGNEKEYSIVKFKIEPGKETTVSLEPGKGDIEDGYFWLRYPKYYKEIK